MVGASLAFLLFDLASLNNDDTHDGVHLAGALPFGLFGRMAGLH